MTGQELDWFTSYLSGRLQVYKIKDNLSETLPVCFGVPQGSILGPLLFTMYINDLPSNVNKNTSKICLFEDDAAIFVRSQNVNEINKILNDELAKGLDWLNNNKLTLNVKNKQTNKQTNKQKQTNKTKTKNKNKKTKKPEDKILSEVKMLMKLIKFSMMNLPKFWIG